MAEVGLRVHCLQQMCPINVRLAEGSEWSRDKKCGVSMNTPHHQLTYIGASYGITKIPYCGCSCIIDGRNYDRVSRWRTMAARTFDLKDAYRQCAVCPSSSKFAHIAVKNPKDGGSSIFRMLALPFGSIKSVRSLKWHIAYGYPGRPFGHPCDQLLGRTCLWRTVSDSISGAENCTVTRRSPAHWPVMS